MSRHRSSRFQLVVVLIFISLVLSSLLPATIRVMLESLLLVWGLWPLVQTRVPRRVFYASGLLLIVALYWGFLLFHPNVPSIDVGLLGWRKSIIALSGIPIGLQLRRHLGETRVERMVVGTLMIAIAASILVYLLLPGLEEGIVREAGDATATLEGSPRLQGLFAGPFHVAVASAFLLSWSSLRFRQSRLLAVLSAGVGACGLLMSNVRTGYVALFAVACVLLLVRAVGDEPRRSTAQRRSVVLVSAILFGVFVGFGGSNTALESFSSISSDDRLTNRFEAWGSAIDAVESSPVTGHGAGAAGDTLGAEFRENGGHWTSHNVLLKWAVEGGVIGLGLVLWLLFVGLSPAVRGAGGLASPAGVVVVLLAAFGMTGAIIEAMPVSFFLLTLAAASVQETPSARTAQGCELSDVMADPNRRQRT